MRSSQSRCSGRSRWSGILKEHPIERGKILAVDQEMKPRAFKDFLGWEVIHYSVPGVPTEAGSSGDRVHPGARGQESQGQVQGTQDGAARISG